MCLLWLWVEAEQPQQSLTIETYPKVPVTASSCTSHSRLLARLCHCCSNPAISVEFPWQWDEGEQQWLGVGCRWRAGITALTVYMDGLYILLIVEELYNCACKVLIGWSEIHHGNNVRELGVRSAYTREMQVCNPGWIYGSSTPGLFTLRCSLYLHADNNSATKVAMVVKINMVLWFSTVVCCDDVKQSVRLCCVSCWTNAAWNTTVTLTVIQKNPDKHI